MAEEAAQMFGINETEARDNHHGHKFQEQSLIRLMEESKTGVKGLLERGIDGVPSEFVRPPRQRPQPSQICTARHIPPDYLINKINCMREQKLAMNYYPECPEPELALGIGGHPDPGSLTVLLQDQVGGLQVSNDGHWVAVDPLPGSLVINLGDQIQILSNDRFKSVEHRAVTNAHSPRVSIATFFSMRSDSSIGFGPIQELLNESQPALYREIGSDEYLQYFFSRALDGKSRLEFARLK